jgi:glucose/arabinose dehydrogenase
MNPKPVTKKSGPTNSAPWRLVLAAVLLAVTAAGCGANEPGSSSALLSIGEGLKGPAGTKATVYAKGLRRMSAFALDSRGRLWVATSAATKHANDGVYLVPARGAKPVKVIAGLRGPLGLVWKGGRLYVSSLGRVDAFSGLHGNRFAKRETILRGPVAGGENNNLVEAPDGRLLIGVSASCDHCTPKSRYSGAVVSFRPDGGDLRVYAGGIRAAYGLAYYPGTSDLFASMNQRDDLGKQTPGDWLAVVREGQDWKFPKCYGQAGAACAGVPKPVGVLDEHAAAGGVAIVTGGLGESVGNAALVAEWQAGKVLRVGLTRSGSTYAGSVKPFLMGLKNPLPLLGAGDGAVLVGDWTTGLVYRIAPA